MYQYSHASRCTVTAIHARPSLVTTAARNPAAAIPLCHACRRAISIAAPKQINTATITPRPRAAPMWFDSSAPALDIPRPGHGSPQQDNERKVKLGKSMFTCMFAVHPVHEIVLTTFRAQLFAFSKNGFPRCCNRPSPRRSWRPTFRSTYFHQHIHICRQSLGV